VNVASSVSSGRVPGQLGGHGASHTLPRRSSTGGLVAAIATPTATLNPVRKTMLAEMTLIL